MDDLFLAKHPSANQILVQTATGSFYVLSAQSLLSEMLPRAYYVYDATTDHNRHSKTKGAHIYTNKNPLGSLPLTKRLSSQFLSEKGEPELSSRYRPR